MGKDSAIQWTDHTFNPWWGCTKVSPACDHCYAESFAKRTGHAVWGKTEARRFFGENHWAEPVKWNREAEKAGVRARVFCASMADVFEDRKELDEVRVRLWHVVESTPLLDWQLLTKRPMNISKMVPPKWLSTPRLNVWYGTTVESPEYLWRVDALRDVPAVVRFISYEPALADVQWSLDGIHWLIAGGESGAGHRPVSSEWLRLTRDQCKSAGVAFFFKQWGGFTPKAGGRVLDGREWNEMPVSMSAAVASAGFVQGTMRRVK